MKKLVLITTLLLIAVISHGQNLQKGNLIGTHVMTVTLNQGVTMDKFIEFFNSRLKPAIEKNMPGWQCYMVKGVRGENSNSFGLIYVIKSEKDRDKYYNADGSDSELGKAANAKLQPVVDEMLKLGTISTKFTDWVVL